ncbi:MAG: PleD family two-component system response regulator [Pseudobdellovibrionaceae bacterium]
MSARILVVDDILPNVKLLEAKLTAEYYEVVTAMNGEQALSKAAETRPDLILLDVMMPGMDGFEVCRRLKADNDLAHIPVVMVTALTDTQDRVKGLESGADDFLSKPVNDTALMARVRSLLRLKMAIDEWRTRETTATQLGVVNDNASIMEENAAHANILVVEDMEFEIQKIRTTLEAAEHTMTIVPRGLEAMQASRDQSFDLIVISLNLQEEDGLRLCSHLRSNEKTRSVPILMIGSEDDMPRIANGLEIGAHDYIMRPIDKNELMARVRTQVRRKRFQERLRTSFEMSLSMALTDTLTGLYNRRYFEVHLAKILEKVNESQKPVGLLYMDIDHFKSINDNYGHNVGDEVLKIFAKRLGDNLRSFDLVARLGGEEFVAVLPDTDKNMAYTIAERLRRSIMDAPFKTSYEEPLSVTTSIGGIVIDPGTENTITQVLERADGQLYKAKHGGRNSVFFEDYGKLDPETFRPQSRPILKDSE